MFDDFFNWVFGSIINNLSPFWSVVVISMILTLLVTLAYKFLTNQQEIKKLKGESKELRKQMKDHKENEDKRLEIQKKSMEKSLKMMKQTMRPALFYMIPLLIVFSWLRNTFKGSGELLSWGFSIPLLGSGFGWLGVYILTTLIFNGIARKLLRVH